MQVVNEVQEARKNHFVREPEGVNEDSLADARGERLEFQILRHSTRGYTPVRKSAGWLKSAVFGKAFRLTRQLDDLGHPDFTLEAK